MDRRPNSRPPRRFFYGYVVVAAAFVLSFASGPGQSFLFSVFQPEILRDTGLSATRFSLIYALGSGFSAALVLVLGRTLDRFGSRAVSFVLALLLIGASAGMAMATGFFSLLVALAVPPGRTSRAPLHPDHTPDPPPPLHPGPPSPPPRTTSASSPPCSARPSAP